MIANQAPRACVAIHDLFVSFTRWGQTVQALNGVRLDIVPGEWVLLVGDNGAGKSTLLKAISGQLRPDRGCVSVDGQHAHQIEPSNRARKVFMVHQDPLIGTAPLLTVFENLLVADPQISTSKPSRSELTERYLELLRPIGLSERLRQPVKLLSGGERQLLATAVASLREVPIILLDEPLAALDPRRAELCTMQIRDMRRRRKTVIQVAHDVRLLQSSVDRIIRLEKGRVVPTCARAAIDDALTG
jgi:putative ABC transport system ATP-binding protein